MQAPQSQRWYLKPTLDLDSDRFRYFNHRRRTRQRSTASKLQIDRDRACEVRPMVLIRESSTQLIVYSLDTCIRYSTYSPIFKSQKGSIEALNFFILTSSIISQLPHNHRKINCYWGCNYYSSYLGFRM
jgi:hypothetical protein